MVQTGDIGRLVSLCKEAMRIHGQNWPAIQRHIRSGLDRWTEQDRARLDAVVKLLLPAVQDGDRKSH